MRILHLSKMPLLYPYGGAGKAERSVLFALAARGHEVCAVTTSAGGLPLDIRPTDEVATTDYGRTIRRDGVVVQCIDRTSFAYSARWQTSFLTALVNDYRPEVIISTEDGDFAGSESLSFSWLRLALELAPDRVVYVAHAAETLPFGELAMVSWAGPKYAALLDRARLVVTPSAFIRDYVARHVSTPRHLHYYDVYGRPAEIIDLTEQPGDRVLHVNPSGVKGIDVTLGLATARPELLFLAVPTWATTPEDEARLRACPNIELAPAAPIDELLRRASVLLAPSLWHEAFGLVVVEAMARGVPVLGSAVGGLIEAKLGVPYTLPVTPISEYDGFDAARRSKPSVPPQALGPWLEALDRVTSDRAHAHDLRVRSRAAAMAFLARLDLAPLEQALLAVART